MSGFANAIGGYIVPRATGEVDPESGFDVFLFRQADARLVGAEARVDVHPHALHGLGVHLAGDLTRGTDTETDAPLPFVPPARLQIAVEYQADRVGAFRDLEARVGPTLVAAQRRPEVADEVPTDGYTVWSASVSASVPVGGDHADADAGRRQPDRRGVCGPAEPVPPVRRPGTGPERPPGAAGVVLTDPPTARPASVPSRRDRGGRGRSFITPPFARADGLGTLPVPL